MGVAMVARVGGNPSLASGGGQRMCGWPDAPRISGDAVRACAVPLENAAVTENELTELRREHVADS